MKRIVSGFAAVLLSLSAAPAVAQGGERGSGSRYGGGDGWTVSAYDDHCALLVDFRSGASLFVGYTVGPNKARVSITSPSFDSIKDGRPYPVGLFFRKGAALNQTWGRRIMTGLVTAGGERGIYTSLEGREFLSDLRRSDLLFLTRDNDKVLVASLDLKGSTRWVQALEQCSQKVHRRNPADPFSG